MSDPTHRHIPSGAMVFPDGYDPADLEELEPGYFAAAELARVKSELRASLDRGAGVFIASLITDIPRQDARYQLKAEEAVAWLQTPEADRDPADAAYPFIRAEAERCAGEASVATITSRAQIILAAATQLVAAEPHIEAARVAGKEAITAAATVEEARVAATVDWAALVA